MTEIKITSQTNYNNLLITFKTEFKRFLDKGVLATLNQVIDVIQSEYDINLSDKQSLLILNNWYEKIVSFQIISKYIKDPDIHDISIHNGPIAHIKGVNINKRFILNCNSVDLEILFDVLALSFGQDWNFNNPFSSFQCKISNIILRATLVHFSLESNNHSKLFLRKIQKVPLPISSWGFNSSLLEILKNAINTQQNIVLSGATGSGKTTLLRALCQIIDNDEHIVVIEDTHEIMPIHPLQTSLLARNSNNYKMANLVAYSLRLTPDRIIVGEIRSKEVIPFVLGMNTGHRGMLSTIHADTAPETIKRLALLYLIESKGNLSFNNTINLICTNIDLVIHLKEKKITEIIKVLGSGEGVPYYETIYEANEN